MLYNNFRICELKIIYKLICTIIILYIVINNFERLKCSYFPLYWELMNCYVFLIYMKKIDFELYFLVLIPFYARSFVEIMPF